MRTQTIALTALLALTSGCAALTPDATRIAHVHVSHPLAGEPFGPANEEDSLDMIEFSVEYKLPGRAFSEVGCGQKIADGGFYGPKFTCAIRTGFYLTGGRD